MLIEIYQGVSIKFDANKDEFYTDIQISPKGKAKKEYIRAGRLGKVHSEIDKYLSVAKQKPLMPQAWILCRNSEGKYELVDVISYNSLSNQITFKRKDSQEPETKGMNGGYKDDMFFLSCKENDAIVTNLNKKAKEIQKIKNEVSCSGGKLIQLKPEHFHAI
jgi:hypothetical protein